MGPGLGHTRLQFRCSAAITCETVGYITAIPVESYPISLGFKVGLFHGSCSYSMDDKSQQFPAEGWEVLKAVWFRTA